MNYLGDFRGDQTVYCFWTTADGSGASVDRATNGTLYVYKDDATGTEVTTGVTDTEGFDGLTGVHLATIATTDSFYEVGHDYAVILKTATIDGQSVDSVVGTFSIENRQNEDGIAGELTGATSSTVFADSSLSATDDFYNGAVLAFTSGTYAGLARTVSDYVGSTGTITVSPALPGTPSTGDRFRILGIG